MATLFTYEESVILLKLLIAHLLTDFFWQPDKWVKDKCVRVWRSKYLWYHGLLTGAVVWLLLFDWRLWWAVLLIAVTHTVIDGLKLQQSLAYSRKEDHPTESKAKYHLKLFVADQLLHILILLITWLLIIKGCSRAIDLLTLLFSDYRILIRLLGYLFVAGPAGYYIGIFTRRWSEELNMQDSLKEAGKWIGILERILILTLVYTQQYAAIGILMAAKSILRVIDKPDSTHSDKGFIQPFSSRKHTEYVLIGTFLSLCISLLTGLTITLLLKA
jgi:hypothetical protein